MSIVANLVTLLGFHQLVDNPAVPKGNYCAVLEILSLLSTGAIAGFWGLNYQEAFDDEKHLLNSISALFVLLFYALFFFVCFYMGKSEELQKAPAVSWVVPGIMVLLLEINAVIDIFDYRHFPAADR